MTIEIKKISVVVPVFNEETNVLALIDRLLEVFKTLNCEYEIIFSADPCSDNTIPILLQQRQCNNAIKLITMSRRFGQSAATIAGLKASTGDCIVVIDADLQDPPEVIIKMAERFKEGYQVVHARRSKRLGENIIRLVITSMGYLLINILSSTNIPKGVGDFKMLSRKVVNNILDLKEANIFFKGLVSHVGFNQVIVDYVREPRYSGVAHYSQLWGSIPLALNGIYCYSNKPLYFISLVGFLASSISFLIILAFVLSKVFGAPIASGITTVVTLLCLFSGLILFSIGILGEYIGRIFDEVKGRTRYIIDEEYL